MKAETVVSAVERFFLDIIGTVVPGGLLLGGVWYVAGSPAPSGLPFQEDWLWATVLGLSYMAGHLLASLSRPLQWAVGWVSTGLKKVPKLGGIVPRTMDRDQSLLEEISRGGDFKGFARAVSRWYPEFLEAGRKAVHPARNVALSLVPERQGQVFRFMFLSLLNFGVATALVLIVLAWQVLVILKRWDVAFVVDPLPMQEGWALFWFVLALPFVERGYYFQSIARRVAFPMASVAVLQGAINKEEPTREQEGADSAGLRIYLAGGFYSGWQDRVVEAWRGDFVDPRQHRLKGEAHYTFWDLEAIRSCDILFAYLEPTNPGGYALALEMGYAKALGKRVILVDERSKEEPNLRRYFSMLWASADLTFDDFDEAVAFLETLTFADLEHAGGVQ